MSPLISGQNALKNSTEKPSGPGAVLFLISLIVISNSSKVKGLVKTHYQFPGAAGWWAINLHLNAYLPPQHIQTTFCNNL
jgi:hypothetical protein